MSIYIGKTPISSAWSSVSATTSNSSTPLILTSDYKENFIQFQNFRLGQVKENNHSLFQLYHSNVLLTNYNSNLLHHSSEARFRQNMTVQANMYVASNLTTQTTSACNLTIQMKTGIPLNILNTSNSQTIFQIGLDGQTYFTSNLGIGMVSSGAYQLEIADSMRVQSNLIIGNTYTTNKLNTDRIYETNSPSTRIEFNAANIHLVSSNTIINNPALKGIITYGSVITLEESTINNLEASNLRIYNNKTNQQGIYINQLNPGSFANTATGNPLHIESYFATPNRSIPIFVVDSIGRISSGKTTVAIPDPDAGYSYYIDKDRYPYLDGFFQLVSCNILDQTIINKQGYISIGSNQTSSPLQIVYTYSGYESEQPTVNSLIGLYQTGSNQYSYLQCYDSNQTTLLQITNTGKVLFTSQPQYDSSYQLEIQKRAYIRTLDTSNIFSSTGVIQFQNSDLSNIQRLDTNYVYAQSGTLSNVFLHNATVDNLILDAFDYISKKPNYEEFRILPDRFLFYGSNLVMNPNPYFFEIEQTVLPDDNVRIYANGGPTQNVNVIKTIGNNQQSQVRIYNCNVSLNSISRTILKASQDSYTFGVINLSTTPGEQSEAFITNNSDLTIRNRQLSIHPQGIRIGESIHFLKDGTATIGYTTPGKRTLTVVGETELKNNAGQPAVFIKNDGNIGIGTNTPRTGLELQSPTVYLSGNLGIGKLNPNYEVDVNGTVRATRVLGALLDDVIGGSFTSVTPWFTTSTSNIYYTSNVGIGTTNPNVLFHLHSCNLDTRKHIEVAPAYYIGSWPPVSSSFTQVVNSNIAATLTCNINAPFMPRYPANYLTANVRNVTTALYGNGVYTAKSSSTESGIPAYYTFNNNSSDYWASDSSTVYRYNATSGAYEGDTILGGISGEWIQLFCPNTFILRKYTLSGPSREEDPPDSSYDIVSPRNWTLLASNTSSGGWNTLHTVTDGYIGSGTYTKTYHLNQDVAYNVYAIVVTKANESLATYGQIGISDLQFYEGSNERNIYLGTYDTYQLLGNTSNVTTISNTATTYNSGTYKVDMTSNYTQQPYLDLNYSFEVSSLPYYLQYLTSNSYIQQSELSGLLNANSTATFTTLSNAFISTTDTNPPLSLQLSYPSLSEPILTYSIIGPSEINYAPRKWKVSGSINTIDWTQIDARDTITWSSNETKSFTLSSPSTYSYYRYDFYRNNSSTYAPLSIKRILAYGKIPTDAALMTYTAYPSSIPSSNLPPTSNLSQMNISGSVVIGSNSMTLNVTPPNNSMIIDGSLGIGTMLPLKPLHVEGDVRIGGNMSNEGRLYIGKNSGGNIGGGIYFGGTLGDQSYDHTVIENRVYTVDTDHSELLFFKGNDTNSTSNGPERIRLRSGEIRFDIYEQGEDVNRFTSDSNVIRVNSNASMTVNRTFITSNLITPNIKSGNVGAFYQYTYYSAGTYTLPGPPEFAYSQARIQMWGAGGGGAGGNLQGTINSAGTILGGGGAGGGGAYGEVILPTELLSNVTLIATIGTGGSGGTYGSLGTTITTTTNSTNATNGTAGTATTLTLTASSLSYTWTVNGGGGGSTSTTTSAGNLGAGGYPVASTNFTISQKGGDGGRGGTTNTGGDNGGILIGNGYAASGGGGGAGSPATNTNTFLTYSGGNSGNASKIESYLIGNTAFAYGSKYTINGGLIQLGQNGYSIEDTYSGGTGGGGGYGYTANVSGGYIGDGNFGWSGGYPGGGGGGGASARTIVPNTSTIVYGDGGQGGPGADGGLVLTYY